MDIKKFSEMLLQGIKNGSMPNVEVEQIKDSLFGIAVSDDSQFLIKIGRREPEREETFLEMEDEDNKIHEIYERFANSWAYDLILRHNDFDIDGIVGDMEIKVYRKLEDYIIQYCTKNNELLFRLGFKYAWSLFIECSKREEKIKLKDIQI